jgi:protein-S-isoprenylcysteine O-methyltransferase Ste14
MNPVRTKGWVLVGAQGVLLAFLVLVPSKRAWVVPTPLHVLGECLLWGGLAGVVLGALGLGLAASVHPEPTTRAVLRTTGPYRFVRHPIYSGVLLFAAGVTITAGSVLDVLVFGALIGLLSLKARFEERLLAQRFAGYAEYARVTPRFVPRLRPR